MKLLTSLGLVSSALLLTACGGSGSSTSSTSTATTAAGPYQYVVPPLNSSRTYSQTTTDTAGNSISLTYEDTITAVNTNVSYMYTESFSDYTVNSLPAQSPVISDTYNANDFGQLLTSFSTPATGSATACTYSPNGPGPNFPISVGGTWTVTYTETCGSGAPISFTQNGTVVDEESVTVPAGTYSTVKLQSTLVWTDANGTVHTENITNWRDVNTGVSVQSSDTFTYSGTASTAVLPLSEKTALQSGTL